MKINVIAKPNARMEKMEQDKDGTYLVSVKEPPIQGRANRAIIKLFSELFDTAPTNINIISGYTSRNKIIEINK